MVVMCAPVGLNYGTLSINVEWEAKAGYPDLVNPLQRPAFAGEFIRPVPGAYWTLVQQAL